MRFAYGTETVRRYNEEKTSTTLNQIVIIYAQILQAKFSMYIIHQYILRMFYNIAMRNAL